MSLCVFRAPFVLDPILPPQESVTRRGITPDMTPPTSLGLSPSGPISRHQQCHFEQLLAQLLRNTDLLETMITITTLNFKSIELRLCANKVIAIGYCISAQA
jgi:hypothetical protein